MDEPPRPTFPLNYVVSTRVCYSAFGAEVQTVDTLAHSPVRQVLILHVLCHIVSHKSINALSALNADFDVHLSRIDTVLPGKILRVCYHGLGG